MPRTYLLILSLVICTVSTGQDLALIKSFKGKIFVSKRLEYLKILTDTTLYSSINSYTDTALFFFKSDTLYIRQKYLRTDGSGTKWIEEYYKYELVNSNPDTLMLKNNYRFDYKPDDWEDTLMFVNIENLKESTKNFRFLKLHFSSPWSGARHITINNLGKITFVDTSYNINDPKSFKKPKTSRIQGQLTPGEFANFKTVLSKSLPSKLPLERSCPIDGSTSDFVIRIDAKTITSTGCELSWPHAFLLNYVYNIHQNKGFVKLGKQPMHNTGLPKAAKH